jgi:membrane protein implicated in regulation of membrane protease activity
MPRGPTILLLGAGLLLLAIGVAVGFALGATAQTIGIRTPLYSAIVVFLAIFVVGMVYIVYRFVESYRHELRSLQDPARGGFTSLSVQLDGRGSIASVAELVRALRDLEERMAAIQRTSAGGEAPATGVDADFATPSESVQNKAPV